MSTFNISVWHQLFSQWSCLLTVLHLSKGSYFLISLFLLSFSKNYCIVQLQLSHLPPTTPPHILNIKILIFAAWLQWICSSSFSSFFYLDSSSVKYLFKSLFAVFFEEKVLFFSFSYWFLLIIYYIIFIYYYMWKIPF